ncbi:MAG: SIMPL domain-containing protein [Pseudomonadota bacterium]
MPNKLLAIAGTLALAMPATVFAQVEDAKMPGVIHVTESATVDVIPDIVSISAGVESNAVTAKEAMTINSELMQNVFDALEQNGIERKDISTSYLNLNPVYDYERRVEGQPRLIGYEASNQITVKSRDLDSTGLLIDAMINAGVNNIDDVNFRVSDSEDAQGEALRSAIKDAKTKAEMMADASGVKLGRLLSMKEGRSPGPMVYDEIVVTASRSANAAPPISPKQQTISATVTLSYAILD